MKYLIILGFLVLTTFPTEARNIPEGYYYGGEAIVTKWPVTTTAKPLPNEHHDTKDPGWLRQLLLQFGKMASKIGNSMGGHANKITAALDKICEVVKTVIPLLAAVCHVGEFGFCAATNEAPIKLAEAMNPNNLDLDGLD
ncbi:uncharacterized protein [Euwallacea fornicatus]|uniref:uncharacterized protein n=1 Tax=Euwallacea fornicatus TaxID=995702 RepID=UPI00338E8069